MRTSPGKGQAESRGHAPSHLSSRGLRLLLPARFGSERLAPTGSRGGPCRERTLQPSHRLRGLRRPSGLPSGCLTGKSRTLSLFFPDLPSSPRRRCPFRPVSQEQRARLRNRRQLAIAVLVRQYIGHLARARLRKEKSSAWLPRLEAPSTFVLSCSRWWLPGQLAASAASLPPECSVAQVRPG